MPVRRRLPLDLAKEVLFARVHAFRPIFVAGIGGSGNTLVAALLDERFAVGGLADESALYAPAASPFRIRSTGSYPDLRTYVADAMIADTIPAATLRRALCRVYRRALRPFAGTRVILDKAPNTHLLRADALIRAFPEGRFVLVFRDPLANIEGLRRKWTLFRKAPLDEVCRFWASAHEGFLAATADCAEAPIVIAYEDMASQPDTVLGRVSRALDLVPRPTPRARKDRRNEPGFALRNVREGRIVIDGAANRASLEALSPAERAVIGDLTGDVYARLVAAAGQRAA